MNLLAYLQLAAQLLTAIAEAVAAFESTLPPAHPAKTAMGNVSSLLIMAGRQMDQAATAISQP